VVKKTPAALPRHEDTGQTGLRHPSRGQFSIPRMAKLKSTYTDKLPQMIHPATGRINQLSQATAVTGACPVPSRICRTFPRAPWRAAASAKPSSRRRASAGVGRYSQIELRIMANLSDDAGC